NLSLPQRLRRCGGGPTGVSCCRPRVRRSRRLPVSPHLLTSIPILGRRNGEVVVKMPSAIARWRRVHLGIALATLVGVVAGYVAAVFYPGPFDMPAAAAPKAPAASTSVPGATPAQLTPQPSPPIPVLTPRVQSVS